MKVIITFIFAANTNDQQKKNKTVKKYILKSLLVLFIVNVSFAQTTAIDFTTNDCNGTSHQLFSELDAGNVIVISWVMPCFSCISPSLAAYSAVQSFASSHPGKVHFYIADDAISPIYGQCSSLPAWASSNNMPNSIFFQSADVNMNGYGDPGMPKVVVLGGNAHTIFYNQNDSHINFNGVQTAINDALAAPLGVNEQKNSHFELFSFPNPSNGLLNITYKVSKVENITFEIVNILGETILYINDNLFSTLGTCKKTIDISRLERGIYFLNASSQSNTETLRFLVAH